jgi:hypothetical protein
MRTKQSAVNVERDQSCVKDEGRKRSHLKLLTRAGGDGDEKRQTREASATRRECDGSKIEHEIEEIEQSRVRHEGNAREVEDFARKREKKVSNIRKNSFQSLAVEESFKGCKKTRKR